MYTIDDAIEDMRDEFCGNCRNYKGMWFDEEQGRTVCVFCD